MTAFHSAFVHPDQSVTYCGEVDQAHVEEARAIAAVEGTPRFVVEHPRRPGSVFVLREDGDLDWYEPVDAAPFEIRRPDPAARPPAADDDQPGSDAGTAGSDAGTQGSDAGTPGTDVRTLGTDART
ncbi:hypothetical protein FNH04_41560, partial [Streptomyces phyllanthi]|nr:hypothetical protein [Streptomyces phyllanthi]